MRCLVTGGAGFLGSHLAELLVERGYDVIILDDMSSGQMVNVETFRDKIELFKADLADAAWIDQLPPVDAVFHLGANASVPTSVKNPQRDLMSNTVGTLNALDYTRKHDARFLLASTAAVYGTPQYAPTDESHPLLPVSPYGISKAAAENYTELFRTQYGVQTQIVRFYNVYGPRQPRYVVYDFARKLTNDAPTAPILGDGKQRRSLLYVRDAVETVLLVFEKGDHTPYNIGLEQTITVLELMAIMKQVFQIDKPIEFTGESWIGDIPALVPNTAKVRALGFEQKVPLDEGLARFKAWFDEAFSRVSS